LVTDMWKKSYVEHLEIDRTLVVDRIWREEKE
jgi:hypothetical protein